MAALTPMEVKAVQAIFDLEKPAFDKKPLSWLELRSVPTMDPAVVARYHGKASLGNEILLFHGTPLENHASILSQGFELRPGMVGHIGTGIYLSDTLEQALYYQLKNDYTGQETHFRIVVCRVWLGNCAVRSRDPSSTQVVTADSHWTTVTNDRPRPHSKEYCVPDVARVLPVGVLVLECQANGMLEEPKKGRTPRLRTNVRPPKRRKQ